MQLASVPKLLTCSVVAVSLLLAAITLLACCYVAVPMTGREGFVSA